MPREFHGIWRNTGDVQSETDTTTLYIGERDRMRIVEAHEISFVDRLLTWKESLDSSFKSDGTVEYARREKYDSAQGRMDTIVNFIVKGDRVYVRTEEDITRGSVFSRTGDTVRFTYRDTTIFETGELFRVRQVEKGLWVINIRDGKFKEAKGWWLVMLAEQKGDRIMVHTFSDRMTTHPSLVGDVAEEYYYDLDLKASDIRTMFRDSLFSPYLELVRVDPTR